jgi:hypothetical protein
MKSAEVVNNSDSARATIATRAGCAGFRYSIIVQLACRDHRRCTA